MAKRTRIRSSYLIVTGSSAGGIEALGALLASIPSDMPAPIVVAQHLDPATRSRLPEILSKRTPLPVRTVENKEQLEPGVIFVVPANRNVTIDDHVVAVHESSLVGSRPSIDLLFRTAADAYKENLIAVVLSGMGSDGAVGARAVKKQGGTVIIQDPKNAMFPSMPLSLAPSTVDIVASTEKIGPLLRDLVTGVYLPGESAEKADLRSLLAQVRDAVGMDFSNYREPTILRRLTRLMAAAGCQSVREYAHWLQRHPEAYQKLIASFLIKVTEFFRDPELFDALRSKVLPEAIEYARRESKDLRVWSAGCATGEETYSIAILIAELLGHEDNVNVRIFGTDLDEAAVVFARRGVYADDALSDVPAEVKQKYFTHADGVNEVSKRIRAMTVFGQHDLAQRAPFPYIDLVLCRNVLIYFTSELQQRALELFAYSLRAGGTLVLGKSEMANTPLPEYFEPVDRVFKIFRRRAVHANLPFGETRTTYSMPARPLLQPTRPSPSLERQPMQTANEVLGGLLALAPVGIITVDRNYDIRSINNAARDLLDIRTVAVGEDLLHLIVSTPTQKLREIIDAALRNEASPGLTCVLEIKTTGSARPRHVGIAAYSGRESDMTIVGAILILTDVTEAVAQQVVTSRAQTENQTAMDQIARENQELTEQYRSLLNANKELLESNIVFRGDNERLIVSIEEAESSTEEIETLNEELQSANEELETINEELQATVEELKTVNDELEAREGGLKAAAARHEKQRSDGESTRPRLEGAFQALPYPIAFIDDGGNISFSNIAYKQLANRRLALYDKNGKILTLKAIAKRARSKPVVFSGEARAAGGQAERLRARAIPLGNEEDGSGVVVLFRLISGDGKP